MNTNFLFKGFYLFDDDPSAEDIMSYSGLSSLSSGSETFCKSNFNLLHINCRSVLNKLNDQELLINSFHMVPDVIMLSET